MVIVAYGGTRGGGRDAVVVVARARWASNINLYVGHDKVLIYQDQRRGPTSLAKAKSIASGDHLHEMWDNRPHPFYARHPPFTR